MRPAKKKFSIWRGATFRYRFTYLDGGSDGDPRDLTGYQARLTLKDSHGPILFELDSEESTSDGALTLGGTAGTIDIVISDEATSDFTWNSAIYELLIEAPNNGDVTAILVGGFAVSGL